MKDLVEYIVKQLVTNPDAVTVEETTDGTQVNLLLKVDPSDMGIVIGKSGQTIKSIRKLLLVKAISDEVRVNLQLYDVSRPEPEGQMKSDEIRASENADEPEKSEEAETSESAETLSPSESAEEQAKTDSTPQVSLSDEEKAKETPNPSTDAQDNKE